MWRRVALSLAVAVAAGAACAEPRLSRQYALYIFEPIVGPKIYAMDGAAGATAAEVEGCAGRVLNDARAIIGRIEARRARDEASDDDLVTVTSIGGNVHLGSCRGHDENDEDADDADEEADEEVGEPSDTLVVLEDMSARQARRVIGEMDALSREDQARMRAELGLR